MRRGAGYVLVLLGAFFLALAVLLPTLVVPQVEKVDLDEYAITVADGSGSYLNPTNLEFVDGADVTVTRVTRGDVEASGDDVAVWEQSQTVEVSGLDAPLRVDQEQVVFDRSSGIGTGGRGDRPSHEGAYVFKLPFNTEKGEYLLHDVTAGKAFPVTFERETEVDGLAVYEFRGDIPPQVIREQGVPGRLVGAPDVASVFAEEFYENLGRTVLVEPRTGAIVGGSSSPRRAFRPSEGLGEPVGRETAIFEATVETNAESQDRLVARAGDAKDQLDLLGRTLPVVFGLLGLVLLVVGLLLARSRREQVVDEYEYETVADEDPPTQQF